MHFSFHRDDFQFISILLKRLLFVLIVYTAFRWLFYVFNISIFGTISAKEIIDIVVGGLRFDLSVIAYSNSLVILLMVIPFSFRKFKCYHQIVFSLFVIVNSFAWLIATADIEYYSYNNRRMTLDLFLLVDEVDFTFRDIFIKYWYLIGLFLLSVTSLIIADIRLNSYQKATRYQNHILHSGLCIITLGLSFFAARGAFTGRPLTAINASNYALFEKSSLVTNSPFVFMHSLDMKRIDHTEYFPPAELPEHFTTTRSYNNALRNENMNIVIIVWESLSADFIGKLNEYPGFTPFLDSILNEALVFKNAYANAKRSTEGIPAILSSFPSLVNVAYVRSSYQDNCITGISYYLKKRNYHCSFFHGGNRGTMNFYSFSKKIGFDEYYGREEFSDETYYDGHWGIYDENFMQYYGEQLNAFPQPFLSVILTLSSHHPFNLPEKYQGKFKSGRQPGICEAISYADYSLQRFFEQVSSYKWFTNTLFVITADHPHKLNEHELESYNTLNRQFQVPIIFYCPGKINPGIRDRIAQQIDIMPTLLDFVGYDECFNAFGISLFSDSSNITYQLNNDIYQIQDDQYLLLFDGIRFIEQYAINPGNELNRLFITRENDSVRYLENKLKAIVQTQKSQLITNGFCSCK